MTGAIESVLLRLPGDGAIHMGTRAGKNLHGSLFAAPQPDHFPDRGLSECSLLGKGKAGSQRGIGGQIRNRTNNHPLINDALFAENRVAQGRYGTYSQYSAQPLEKLTLLLI